MLDYAQIRDVLKKNDIITLDTTIALAVEFALPNEVSDEEFNLLCRYVSYCMRDVETGYSQLMADIVVDLYCDCEYGYRKEDFYLTIDELRKIDLGKVDAIVDIYCTLY